MIKRVKKRRSLVSTAATLSVLCFAVLAVVGAIFIARGTPTTPVALPTTIRDLEIKAPSMVNVDEPFGLSVTGAADGDVVSLAIDDAYGLRRFESTTRSGVAAFTIEPSTRPGSGTLVISAKSGFGQGVATVTVSPGPAVDSVALYLGPRTVTANAVDFSMIVAVPVDALGNPVVAATPVDFLVTRPGDVGGNPSDTIGTATVGLLAFANIESGIVAGRTTVTVDVDSAHGPRQSFLEVADVPVDVELSVVGTPVVADGSTLLEIQTSVLTDQHDNVLPDGTTAYLHGDGSAGRRQLSAFTIDGVATWVVEAPSEPGSVEFFSEVSGAVSQTMVVEFAPAVVQLPVELGANDDLLEIEVGPVTAPDGGFVPDGTVAIVEVGSAIVEVELELGYAFLEVESTDEPVSVTVLGVDADEIEDER